MQSDFPDDEDPKRIWQNQPPGPSAPSLEALREKARKLRSKTRRQLLGSSATVLGVTALAVAGGMRTREPGLHIAFALGIVWALAGQYLSLRGIWSALLPGDAAHTSGQEFYRRELLRRSNLLRRFFLWFFGPVVLCFGTLLCEGIILLKHLGRPLLAVAPTSTLFVIWMVAILVIQFRESRDLRREVARLDKTEEDNQSSD